MDLPFTLQLHLARHLGGVTLVHYASLSRALTAALRARAAHEVALADAVRANSPTALLWLLDGAMQSGARAAFQRAACLGRLWACQLLAARSRLTRADVTADKNYAFVWAATNGHLAVCQWLTSTFGLTPRDMADSHFDAPIFAAHNGHLPVVEWLLGQMGGFGKPPWVCTAHRLAVQQRQWDVVAYLEFRFPHGRCDCGGCDCLAHHYCGALVWGGQ